MAPELQKAAKLLGARARVTKMDSDKEPDLSSRLKIGGLPTILAKQAGSSKKNKKRKKRKKKKRKQTASWQQQVYRGGAEVGRIEGAMMADQLVQMVQQYEK
jgi:hypothetical protein